MTDAGSDGDGPDSGEERRETLASKFSNTNDVFSKRLVEQIVDGHLIASGPTVTCTGCHDTVQEGERVLAYAYYESDLDVEAWDVARVYCRDCDRDHIKHPTLGLLEVLVAGRVKTLSDHTEQTTYLVIGSCELVDVVAADVGSGL